MPCNLLFKSSKITHLTRAITWNYAKTIDLLTVYTCKELITNIGDMKSGLGVTFTVQLRPCKYVVLTAFEQEIAWQPYLALWK